ncbi:MAG: ABC transporter ATP-binding protein [Syntrophomonas sp.]|nr:ABC transporter ATP-binding protein [Syntrophomonas sp.]
MNLTLNEGEFVLLCGAAGSGKTTLLRAIAGLVPDFHGGWLEGAIFLDNIPVEQIPHRKRLIKTGIVFQEPERQLLMNTVEAEIAFALENLGFSPALIKRRIMEVAAVLDLSDCLQQATSTLSGGQKQKVVLASVLAWEPEILLLDEPTSQLDPMAAEQILNSIRRLNEDSGLTVILAEQRLERCFHLADRVLVMKNGGIVCDEQSLDKLSHWAMKNEPSCLPPVARLFAGFAFSKIPVSIKEGRGVLRSLAPQFDFPLSFPTASPGCGNKLDAEKSFAQPVVEVEKIWFRYPEGKEVLKDISFNLKAGEFAVLMGPNGAGKSTILKNLNGLLRPGRGKIKICGRDSKGVPVAELATTLAYLSQNPDDYLFLPSVREEVKFSRQHLAVKDDIDGRSEQVLQRFGLSQLAKLNPRDLSSGERQRVALAAVMAANPRILLLDEPTRGLDSRHKEELGRFLQQMQAEGVAILMVSHDVEFVAEYAGKVIFIADGSLLCSGSKYDMLSSSTFYSPQVSKLFRGIAQGIVTLKQAQKLLQRILHQRAQQP